MNLDVIIHSRVDSKSKKALQKAADESGRTLSNYVRLILQQAAKTPYRIPQRLKKGRFLD